MYTTESQVPEIRTWTSLGSHYSTILRTDMVLATVSPSLKGFHASVLFLSPSILQPEWSNTLSYSPKLLFRIIYKFFNMNSKVICIWLYTSSQFSLWSLHSTLWNDFQLSEWATFSPVFTFQVFLPRVCFPLILVNFSSSFRSQFKWHFLQTLSKHTNT